MPKHLDDSPLADDRSADVDCDWPPPRLHPRCPDGNPQRLVEIVGFRLKAEDYLQLRVVLWHEDLGICHVVHDEYPDRVEVDAVACVDEVRAEQRADQGTPDETDCPCNVWLDEPLGGRVVVAIQTGEPLDLCIPGWGRDVPTRYVPRPAGPLWPPTD